MRKLDAGKSKRIIDIVGSLPIFFQWTPAQLELQVMPRLAFFACTPQTALAHFQFGFVLRGRFAETATVKGTRKLRILEGEGRLINLDKILLLDEFADDQLTQKTLVALDESCILGVFEETFVTTMKDLMQESLSSIRDVLTVAAAASSPTTSSKQAADLRLEAARVLSFAQNQSHAVTPLTSFKRAHLTFTVLRGSFKKLDDQSITATSSNRQRDDQAIRVKINELQPPVITLLTSFLPQTYSFGDTIEARSANTTLYCLSDIGGAVLITEKPIQVCIGDTPSSSSTQMNLCKLMDLNSFDLPTSSTQRSSRGSRPKVDLGLFTRRSHVHPTEQKAFFECYADPNVRHSSSHLRTSSSSSQLNGFPAKPASSSSSSSEQSQSSVQLKSSSLYFNKHQRAISLKSTPNLEKVDGFSRQTTPVSHLPLRDNEEKMLTYSRLLSDLLPPGKTDEQQQLLLQSHKFVRSSLPEFEDGKIKRIPLIGGGGGSTSDSQSTAASFMDSPRHGGISHLVGISGSRQGGNHPPRSFQNHLLEEMKRSNSLNTEGTDSPKHNWVSPTASRGFLKSPFAPILSTRNVETPQVLPALMNSAASSRERVNGGQMTNLQSTPRLVFARHQQQLQQQAQRPCLNDEDLMSLHDDIRSLFSKRSDNNVVLGGNSAIFAPKIRSNIVFNNNLQNTNCRSMTEHSSINTAMVTAMNPIAHLPKILPGIHHSNYQQQKPFSSHQLDEVNRFDDYLLKQQLQQQSPRLLTKQEQRIIQLQVVAAIPQLVKCNSSGTSSSNINNTSQLASSAATLKHSQLQQQQQQQHHNSRQEYVSPLSPSEMALLSKQHHERTATFSTSPFLKSKGAAAHQESATKPEELMFTFYNAPFFIPPGQAADQQQPSVQSQ